jgi:hypothetical protein
MLRSTALISGCGNRCLPTKLNGESDMSKSNLATRIAQIGLALLSLTFAGTASALYVEMFAIGDFVPGASGGCGGDDRSSWPGMAEAWYNRMGDFGHFKAGKRVDDNITLQRFCDPSFDSDCRDYSSGAGGSILGVDWADAAIVAFHGWDAGDHWGGTMRYPWKGFCAIEAGGSSNEVRLGDSWIVFFHASSCQSADDDNLDGIRFAMEDASSSTTRRAHQWDGFHGLMWISSSYNDDYRDTASDGHYASVAYSWVTNHHKSNSQGCEWYDPWNWFDTCRDQCPIAYAISNSLDNALTRLTNERYNFVYGDPPDNNWYAIMYYENCHPAGEDPFL